MTAAFQDVVEEAVVKSARARLDALPRTWFGVPFRSKRDTLAMLFGTQWNQHYLPALMPDGFTLHGYLLTSPTEPWIIWAPFQDDPTRWYDPADGPVSLDQPVDPADAAEFARRRHRGEATPRIAARISHLRDVIRGLHADPTIEDLIRWYSSIADQNNQASAIRDALLGHWLRTRDLTPDQVERWRLLVALGGHPVVEDLLASPDQISDLT